MNPLDIKGVFKKIVGYNEKMKDIHVYWRVETDFDGNNKWKKIYVLNDDDYGKRKNKRK